MRNSYIFVFVLGILVALLTIVGFMTVGFPASQQFIKLDQLRADHFESIKYRIEDYFRLNNQLPEKLSVLPRPLEIKDPLTKKDYAYTTVSSISYKLCTEFSLDTTNESNRTYFRYDETNKASYIHKKEYDCIQYTLPEYLKTSNNSNLFVSPTPTPIPKLLGYWKLEELNPAYGVFDSVPQENDGIIVNVQSVEGRIGKAASFSGTLDSYIDVTQNKEIKNIIGDFTLSLWTYRLGTGNMALATTTNDVDGGFGMITGNSGEIYCRTSNGFSYQDSLTDYTSGYLLANNGWHHIAIVRKNTKCSVYVDGIDRTFTKAIHSNIAFNANPLTIGGKPSHNDQMFKGYIDEVKLYNYALSPDQIKKDMK